jgi:hypothetical protein
MNQEVLKKRLDYDPLTGSFVWKQRISDSRNDKIFNTRFAGKIAGVKCPRGYIYIRMRDYGFFSASRLAWLYAHGAWPAQEVDHINGNPSDNRLSNLREASRSENGANRTIHSNNKSGFKGVTKHRNKWAACVRMNNKRYRLGVFDTPELAHKAYLKKAKELHGEYFRE